MVRSRGRKNKNKSFIRYFCLFVLSVILLTSLLIGDDTRAYGEGRNAIFETEYGSNAMSLISVSEEDNRRSTIKNFADVLDMDIYSNLCLNANVENSSDVERDISFDIILPLKTDGSVSELRLINSGLDIFKGDLSGVDIKYELDGKFITEGERKSGKQLDFNKKKRMIL